MQCEEHAAGAGRLHVFAKQAESTTEQQGDNRQCHQATTRQLGVNPSFRMVPQK